VERAVGITVQQEPQGIETLRLMALGQPLVRYVVETIPRIGPATGLGYFCAVVQRLMCSENGY